MFTYNTREIATAIWLVLFSGFMLSQKSVRSAVCDCFRALLNPTIVMTYLFMLAYTILMVWVLSVSSIWRMAMLKDTIAWFLLVGAVAVINSATTKDPLRYLRILMVDSIKLTILIQYLMNAYTFSLPVELILLPSLTLLGMVDEYGKINKEYADVRSVVSPVQAGIGLWIGFTVFLKAIKDYENIATLEVLRKVILTPVLTGGFLLFGYLFALYANYDKLFSNLRMNRDTDAAVVRYAKRRLFLYSKLNLPRLLHLVARSSVLTGVRSKSDVEELLLRM